MCGSREELKKAPLLAESFDYKLDFMIEYDVHCESCLSCPYVTPSGCGIYDDRPLICRLYGATEGFPSMPVRDAVLSAK